MEMPDLKRLKLCLVKYELDINVYNFGFSTKVACAFLLPEHILELSVINTFKHGETTITSTLWITERFHGNRCESDVALFSWRVT